MEIQNKATFEACLKKGVNFFLGAGFSVLAESKAGNLPVGGGLLDELRAKFPGNSKAFDLARLCAVIATKDKQGLDSFLRERFKVASIDDAYYSIFNVSVRNIFTTNVDDLLENIYSTSKNAYLNNATMNGASFSDKKAIDLYHLHGSIHDYENKMLFGPLDMAGAFSNDPAKWLHFRNLMCKYPTIFWGYALQDAGTLQALSDVISDNNMKDSWVVLHPDYYDESEAEYYRSMGLKIIISDTEEFLGYIGSIGGNLNESYVESDELVFFPEYSIPSNTSVEHKAISDFYKGANPDWSYIYSSLIAVTGYYDDIRELMNNGKNVLITGGAATGKTTLLMQLSAHYEYDGAKMYIKDLSPEKARLLVSNISGRRVLLFIDEFQSSLEALSILSKNKNVRYVIAERDYAYLSSSNYKFFSNNCEVIDVTNINREDAQKIYYKIPEDLRRPRFKHEERDSIFELIEKNCRYPDIKSRFDMVIRDLEKVDGRLVEMFLLICYMHRSRSVASMDVLISYFSGRAEYVQIYELVNLLGSSVNDYVGVMRKEEQDYFSIRSNLLADLINDKAPARHMSKMLTEFHVNVSKVSIPNYNVFKRKAYDAWIFERAFPDINDGCSLYDMIYSKSGSPFNIQQKALYLSRRKEHDLAFAEIDRAVAKGGSRNWAIKNSYAIIMFKANINRSKSDDVDKALIESMRVLEFCYSSDVRKTFHAMKYADQAIQYHAKYRNKVALQFLEKAKSWLAEEIEQTNRVGDARRMLERCKKAIQTYS
ncbi:SIR2 family protein [Bacterioplanoides sp.]|uniref:P-loop NTPase n=1 Tax=Bacterioplanoides sp. TaxID=2066072 RepID=UPI003B00D5DF